MTRAKPPAEQGGAGRSQDAVVAAIGSAAVFLLISPFLNFIVMWTWSQAGRELTLAWLTLHVSLPVAALVGVIAYVLARKKTGAE